MKFSDLSTHSLRLLLAAALLTTQTLPASDLAGGSSGLELLIQKAHTLEARDRDDLAAQVWQQVLITNPNQPDALAGLARWAKRSGKNDEANAYLAKLRRVAPDSPALNEVASMDSVSRGGSRLAEASRLAAAQHFDEAMQIYREVFGTNPPPGGWAIAYYETMANTSAGFDPAVAALKKLAETYPDVADYRVAAGRLMTYRPATRSAGVSLLSTVEGPSATVVKARLAWRQALLWEKSNPAYVPSFAAYLKRYSDPELESIASALRTDTAKAGSQGPASKEEQLGYQALKSGNVSEAERQFGDALHKDGSNSQVHAGLAFAHMKEGDFDAAVQQLEAAHKLSPKNSALRESLDTAKFWQAMRLGAKSADEQDWQAASSHYRDALTLRPSDAEAARALGGSLLAAGQPDKAIPYLSQAVRREPSLESAWCSLVQAKLAAEGGASALKTIQSVPASAAASLRQNVNWNALKAASYAETGNDSEARKIFRQITSPEHTNLSVDSQIQLAGLALRLRDPESALRYAQKAAELGPDKPAAWEVLVSALVVAGRPQEAERTFRRMPENAQKTALSHAAFQETLASLMESKGDLEGARAAIEKVLNASSVGGSDQTRTALKIHMVDLLAKLGRNEEAESLLDAVTDENPNNVDVWRARFLFLQRLKRQQDIVTMAGRMPQEVAVRLGAQGDMVNLLASALSASGDPAAGVKLLETYLSHAGDSAEAIPQRLQIGWILLDSPGQNRALYQLLDQLNSRSDLTADQRKDLSNLWATWILRSADAARKSGDSERALALLEQGARMFPANPNLLGILAGDLMAAGKTKRAFNVYATWDLAGGQPDDYAGAIGAAMTEKKTQYAARWTDRALARWPANPKLLSIAGDEAKARGDLKKAEAFWKDALNQKQSPAPDLQVAGADPHPTSLRDLLVGPGETQRASLPDGSATVPVHLSSFQPDSAPREDFVRTNAFAPDADVPTLGANLLTNSVLSSAAPVDSLQDKIASLESRNTPFLDSQTGVWARGGQDGFSKLTIEQSQLEASTILGNQLRASLLLEPTYLSTGAADGSGTALFGKQPVPAPMAAQNATGIAGEAQLSTQTLGLRIGATPEGFLTQNWIAGLRFQPENGPITFLIERDSVKDTMLSYSGARDPESNQVWGGVMADTASVQGHWGDSNSGIYASVGYGTLDGHNVESNTEFNGNFGSWWKVAALPQGSLTVGVNFSGMHYAHDLAYFTFGQGGYFSPQQYYLLNVPVRWTGTYHGRLQYTIGGSLGVQHFTEDASDYYPTDAGLQASSGKQYPAITSTGLNFNLDARLSYQIAPHWLLGAFMNASNARNYTAGSAGLFVKYTFKERPLNLDTVVPSVPDWRGQQPLSLF